MRIFIILGYITGLGILAASIACIEGSPPVAENAKSCVHRDIGDLELAFQSCEMSPIRPKWTPPLKFKYRKFLTYSLNGTDTMSIMFRTRESIKLRKFLSNERSTDVVTAIMALEFLTFAGQTKTISISLAPRPTIFQSTKNNTSICRFF